MKIIMYSIIYITCTNMFASSAMQLSTSYSVLPGNMWNNNSRNKEPQKEFQYIYWTKDKIIQQCAIPSILETLNSDPRFLTRVGITTYKCPVKYVLKLKKD